MSVNYKIDLSYYSINGNRAEDKKLLEPMMYILPVLDKANQTKLKLVQAFNYWLKVSDDKIKPITEIISMLYNMSVLIDDIQDNSDSRRGTPIVHSVFSIANTLSATNYIMFVALERAVNLHPAAMKIYVEQLMEHNRGQGMDMSWRENFICPSEAEYKIMIKKKTGAIFNLAVRLMKLFSSYKEDLSSLVVTLSLYFQARDDYCNLYSSKHTDKSYYENLTEGKFSIPVIHALTTNPNDKQIMSILKQQAKDIEMKHFYVKLLEKFGSLKYTRYLLDELDRTARTEIDRLGGNPLLINILDDLRVWDNMESRIDPQIKIF